MRPLAFARLEVTLSELVMLHAWLAWSGLGAIVVGMRRHGYELRLDSDHEGWKASFLHPLAHLPPVGWPSAHVVADALAGRPRSRLARPEHAACSGLLAH